MTPDAKIEDATGTTIRVLVADDHPLIRDGLRALLGATPGIELVGEAASGDEAIDLAARTRPDVILMDLAMPGRNGIEATREIIAQRPTTGILILTMFLDDDSIFAAVRAGARGYMLKDAGHDEVRRAINAIWRGEALFGAGVAQRMIGFFARTEERTLKPFPELTDRERVVLDELARGASNATIANRLGISQKTVRNHVSTILGKLMVVDRSEAIVRAREAGLGVRRRTAGPNGRPSPPDGRDPDTRGTAGP
jgi:DNA-binding NarL/FixJ family response regulator